MARKISSSFLLPSVIMIMATVQQSNSAGPPANCRRSCKGIDLPYPFGVVGDPEGCYLLPDFGFTCDDSYHLPIYRNHSNRIPVIDISLSQAYMRVLMVTSKDCYNISGPVGPSVWGLPLGTSPYSMSYTRNIFTAVGCDTSALILIGSNNNYGGCITGCNTINNAVDGQCSGVGCCESSIPPGVKWYNASFTPRTNTSKAWLFNNCSYSFLVEKGNYTFQRSDITYLDRNRMLPMILDWVVGNESCEVAAKNKSSYACVSSNSYCVDSTNGGAGYVCNCSVGFQGNPYLANGCQDVDECKLDRRQYPCYGICTNTLGNYNCTCSEGFQSKDPKTTECVPIQFPSSKGLSLGVKLGIGIGCGVGLLLIFGLVICLGLQRRNIIVLRRKCFERNGGVFLQEALSNNVRRSTFQIFMLDELEKATDKFDKNHVLGKGGSGTVYKGKLKDDRVVAIKRSMLVDDKKGREFANEVLVLSEINHRNIVKLFGCCLDDEIPMLVYEFIPGGTLFDLLHKRGRQPISFDRRLKIATEAAEALKYLHVDASPPILHGDVKSANVLLDDGFVAKVSDFGTSIIAPKDMSQFTTLIQGTYGYLDPEYLINGCLTDKSDVFSFGVVLVELLTRRLPYDFRAPVERERNLAINFALCARSNRLDEILDPEIMEDAAAGVVSGDVMKVVEIAMHCVNVKGEDRPGMREVAMALGSVKGVRPMGAGPRPASLSSSSAEMAVPHASPEMEFHLLGGYNSTSVFTTGDFQRTCEPAVLEEGR